MAGIIRIFPPVYVSKYWIYRFPDSKKFQENIGAESRGGVLS